MAIIIKLTDDSLVSILKITDTMTSIPIFYIHSGIVVYHLKDKNRGKIVLFTKYLIDF